MELLIGVLAGLVVLLIGSFLPGYRWLAEQCIEAAAQRLPDRYRELLREEWYADLDAFPKEGWWGFLWAFDILRNAHKVALELKETDIANEANIIRLEFIEMTNYMIVECKEQMLELEEIMVDIEQGDLLGSYCPLKESPLYLLTDDHGVLSDEHFVRVFDVTSETVRRMEELKRLTHIDMSSVVTAREVTTRYFDVLLRRKSFAPK